MFERRIEDTIAFLLKETLDDQDTISSKQIFASEMPRALKRMFERDVESWIDDEKERLLNSPHFRYDEDDIRNVFEHIISQARDYAVFSEEEYRSTLEKNVKLLFNYVCRPQWTLEKYLFADREHASTDDILESLQCFWEYEYYQVILREYFTKKQLTVMTSKKFTEMLEYIDQEVVRSFDSRKLAHLTEPIFNLFAVESAAAEKFVPIEALSIFFDDKKQNAIVERLDREKEQREQITLHDLVMIISEVDYTMSFDISTIVSQHVKGTTPMKPERNVTAGQDFDVPHVETPEHVDRTRKEIGDDDDLDFIISEEEHSVTAHTLDNIPELDEDGLIIDEEPTQEIEVPDAVEELVEEVLPDLGDDEELIDDSPPDVQEFTEEDEAFLAGDDAIIEEDEPEMEELGATDTSILEIENELDERDEIPDMSMEEMEDYALIEEVGQEEFPEAEEEEVYTPEPETPVSDDVPDLSLDDEVLEDEELEIDWDKEAEDIPDVQLDDDENVSAALDAVLPGISLDEEDTLKPAEELLGQLDLDDMDSEETAPAKKVSENDIPIVEEETPPESENEQEEEVQDEPAVPLEEVMAQFGDITKQIPDADKKKYVKKLFQKNESAFTHALQTINGKATWREASEYIDELFIKHDVDMYSRLAVKFTDDIYKRYLTKK
ncbi:MAG: hypothetical protein C0600_14250 [Ignavibacteria bacterium]|nr:MAG: hypothetical protein C0600_14250 [Ignavibacteria bacterium]